MSKNRHVFFVDDDAGISKAVRVTLEGGGFTVTCFTSATDCLDQLDSLECDLLITDVKMPGMGGMELLTQFKRRAPWIPVLIASGKGDIPMATEAFKRGTTDFIQKPLTRDLLLSTIDSILARYQPSDLLLGTKLTTAERRVLHLVLNGKSNKEIAYFLKRSVRTVEVHRRHFMKKFGVDNVVDLVKRATQMGLTGPLNQQHP